MNIITQIIGNLEKNLTKNINLYKLNDFLPINTVKDFNYYLNIVNCIDNISYDFNTYLYSVFISNMDEAFYKSTYRKNFCDVISFQSRSLITLFGEVIITRRYYYDKLKKKYFYYIDDLLELSAYQRFDPFVCAKICELSSHCSYAKAGRITSEMIGKRIKFDDDLNKYLINRSTARNIVLNFNIPNYIYDERPDVKRLYIMLDEKFVPSQFNNNEDHMVKVSVVFENIEKRYKNGNSKQFKLIGKHVCASIDNDLHKQVDDYLFNTYNLENIDEIIFMGDCAKWITNFPNHFKYNSHIKIKFCIDGFHYVQALEHICTKSNEELVDILKSYCENNDKDTFISICDALISSCPERKETIEQKKKYILNNWEYIQTYYEYGCLRCCMESNISHCIADLFTARPRAYSKSGLRHLLKLRLLKVNGVDIQKIYFDVIKGIYKKETKVNIKPFNIGILFDQVIPLPPWLKQIAYDYNI